MGRYPKPEPERFRSTGYVKSLAAAMPSLIWLARSESVPPFITRLLPTLEQMTVLRRRSHSVARWQTSEKGRKEPTG
ncbi:hypothetical protein CBM2633_P40013 [Cupriavidus taiwanensis]|uniref:Uncharacterized protein n=1 Tax=Cupriavidus taiwanensis TaxID=164546 RepID=A0A375F6H0_9BURK|nr:hypothetical protein CBM2588_P50008 [Cupriavidus taiwanensis]SOY76745.1 hypothetical protein CBM2585_P40015 [Cupriavidus taiwanensis]SOY76769.1 hypothetical protein CBM2592_P60008 [Cupriavidus taiwanensis]SOY77102.1 hypothetical protein CBM2589_P40013 [Cupriavidus taiwanensis]SOY78149.1 hypothetical protein CBM2586_P50015 [Cupriavidus taiwanensis]